MPDDTGADAAIRYVYARSASLAQRAVGARNMGDVRGSERLLQRANILAQAVQTLEKDLGRRVATPRSVEPANDLDGIWCDQCDRRVARKEVDLCKSRWCGARP